MESQSPFLWHEDDGVGHLVLNRGRSDAPAAEACKVFGEVVAQAARADVGAILVSSTGKQFSAGGDIHLFASRVDDLDRLVAGVLDVMHPAIHTLATLPLPVISAVHAPIGGAGIAFALCADIVLASPTMKLRGGYSAIGLSPDLGASYYLVRRVGSERAKNILMTNRVLSAEQCLQWGLVDELHPQECLLATARSLARKLAHGATQSLGAVKRLCDAAHGHELRVHLDLEREALLHCARSADAREGVQAFVQKRPARFVDTRID